MAFFAKISKEIQKNRHLKESYSNKHFSEPGQPHLNILPALGLGD